LLIHAEQGLGDIILFSSCLPDLVDRGVHCVIDVPPRLEALFKRSFPTSEVVAHELASSGSDWLATLPEFDRHVPMGTLPKWLRLDQPSFPSRPAYLVGDAKKTTAWRERLAHLPRPHIGISWRGGMVSTSRLQRSIELAEMLTAFKSVQGTWVCVQYGNVDDEVANAQALTGREVHPGLSGYADIDDIAALTSALDGVVTVCSTQAHLSGALGTPAAVLVPANPSWPYGAQGEAMLWYPALTLLRQKHLGCWTDVLDHAAQWIVRADKHRPVTAH
jgi:ADP-heptose:LPS heptosyltransferase